MDRRRFLQASVASGLTLASPRFALAQQGTMKRLAFINTVAASDPAIPPFVAAMKEGLASEGWIEGKNIIIDIRYGIDTPDKSVPVVQELLDLKPDVFITVNTIATLELQKHATFIPAVVAPASDAAMSTLVSNFARPSGNITGLSLGPFTTGKLMQFLKDLAPALTRVGTLYYPSDPSVTPAGITAFAQAASDTSMEPVMLRLESLADVDGILRHFAATPNGGYIYAGLGGSLATNNHSIVADSLIRYRVPHAFGHLVYGSEGVVNYYVDTFDIERRAGTYAGLILNGTKVSDLPVQAPTKYALIVNQNVAKQIGVTVPASILLQADQVVQ